MSRPDGETAGLFQYRDQRLTWRWSEKAVAPDNKSSGCVADRDGRLDRKVIPISVILAHWRGYELYLWTCGRDKFAGTFTPREERASPRLPLSRPTTAKTDSSVGLADISVTTSSRQFADAFLHHKGFASASSERTRLGSDGQ